MTEMSIVYESLNSENDSCFLAESTIVKNDFLAESIIVKNENNRGIIRHGSIIKWFGLKNK